MPGKHNAGGCGCCGECATCSEARDVLVAREGYTGVDVSGGPLIGSPITLDQYPYLSFAHLEDTEQGSAGAYNPYVTGYAYKDFSGTMSSTISTGSCSAPVRDFLCSTEPFAGMSAVLEFEEFAQTGVSPFITDRFRARVLRTEGYESSTDCYYNGSLYLPKAVELRGVVAFSCVAGVATYLLTVSAIVKFALVDRGGANPTGFYYPPGSSSEWTFSGGIYTKNGTNATAGATIAWTDTSGLYSDTLTKLESTAWVSYPTTTVSLWQPTDVIDVTGLLIGTATLV